MRYKSFILFVLIFMVAFALANGQEQSQQSVTADSSMIAKDSSQTAADSSTKLVAYYFHGTRRCANCKKIEAYSQEAIETGFAKDLESGKIEWMALNTDESENSHFVEDYQLYTKSVVLSVRENGKETKWKNLEKVWDHLGDKAAFMKYIQDEVRAIRGEG